MTSILNDIARGVLVAEGMHPANTDYRIHLLSPARFARIEILHAFDRNHVLTTPARPYVHSNPASKLKPGSGENFEWFINTSAVAAAALRDGDAVIYQHWTQLAKEAGRTRPGTHIALANLRRGLRPPQSGHDNPHYFDDLAMVRAAAIACTAGSDGDTVRLIDLDAHVTHDRDGVWAAQATGRLTRALLNGVEPRAAIDAAVDGIPTGTWTRRLAEAAVTSAEGQLSGPYEVAARLSESVADWIYSFPVTAPNTLAKLLAHTLVARTAEELILGASIGERGATTVTALAGAIAAIRFGTAWLPQEFTLEGATMTGISLPHLRDTTAADCLTRAGALA